MVIAVKESLAPMAGIVKESMSLRVQHIPFPLDLHGIVGVTVPAVLGAEGVGTFEADALTHIVGFQCIINAGAPAVLYHPIVDRNCLAVVGAVVLEVASNPDIVIRRCVHFLKVFDHRCEAGNVRNLNVGDAVLDHGGCCF